MVLTMLLPMPLNVFHKNYYDPHETVAHTKKYCPNYYSLFFFFFSITDGELAAVQAKIVYFPLFQQCCKENCIEKRANEKDTTKSEFLTSTHYY